MQFIHSYRSKPTTSTKQSEGPRIPERYCDLPLQLDLETDGLLKNDLNKIIYEDIKVALSSNDTQLVHIDAIFRLAAQNEYRHILKVIVQGLPQLSSNLTYEHLECLNTLDRPEVPTVSETESASITKDDDCRLKLPPTLNSFHPDRLGRYNPLFYRALSRQKFAEKVTVSYSKADKPGSNNFNPEGNELRISPDKTHSRSYALGPIVHEMSHARDFIALGHKAILRSEHTRPNKASLPLGAIHQAEGLFTTELKAWLLEAMQQYLVHQAGGKINPSQERLIEGFRAGSNDIVYASFNEVQSRITSYINQLYSPRPTIKELFADEASPLGNALSGGALLFRTFILDVEKRKGEIDPDFYINRLDTIFHSDFYSTEECGSKNGLDISTLRSIIDMP